MGQYEKAIELYEQDEVMCKDMGDSQRFNQMNMGLGKSFASLGNYTHATNTTLSTGPFHRN